MIFIKNELFEGIVSRKEIEELIAEKGKGLNNVLLISIINPNKKNKKWLRLLEEYNNRKDEKIKREINKIDKEIRRRRFDIEENNSYPLSLEELDNFYDFLTVSFWDVEKDILNYKAISYEEAEKIARFILKYKNRIGKDLKVLIHCSAGISRSAGVGLALKCILRHNGNKYDFSLFPCQIFEYKRYSPNLTVYDRIVESFNKLKNKG